MRKSTLLRFALAVLCAAVASTAAAQGRSAAGKAVYEKTCALCHATGLAGSPKFGDSAAWSPRLHAGIATLYKSALQGTPNGMPGKGGNLSLPDADVKAAVDYMVGAAGGAAKSAAVTPATPKKTPAAAPAAEKTTAAIAITKPANAPVSAAETTAVTVAAAKSAPAAEGAANAGAVQSPLALMVATADPNAFNRLLTPPGARNRPPAEDGIHDAANPGTLALQPPLASFQALPKSNGGNRVDWVAALGGKQLHPRWDMANPKADPVVMDLNIVREVKGSMPDVVYPHKQHTEWLDCSNCHPAIFIPQKGANQISMAAIMLGEKCGVCHGKIAFPVSECRLCHSKNKTASARAEAPTNQEAKK